MVLLEPPIVVCNHCGMRALAQSVNLSPGDGAAQFHECPALGIMAPLIPEGMKADVRKVEREDYVGGETVRLDADGRPIMSVVTVREDGQDAAVFAPLAKASFDG